MLELQKEFPEPKAVQQYLEPFSEKDLQQLIRKMRFAENDITHSRMMLRQLVEADPNNQSDPVLMACGHIIARGAVRSAYLLHSITVFLEAHSRKRFAKK
jgi:hypothetical protein